MPRRALVVTSRVVAGVVGITVATAAIAAAALLPIPTIERVPVGVQVTPEPAAKQLVCPGAVLQLGDSGGQNASVATPIGQPVVTIAASSGSVETTGLTQADGAATAAAPTLATAPASADDTAGIAGAQSQAVDLGDYRGLAAASCASPSSDTWLVGGSTAVGRTTLLTLANPGAVDSTVAIEMFSGDGVVEASGLTGIVVAARSQRVVSLAGFGPGLASIALHVTSQGGPVTANLQQSIVRGIEPGGVDVIGATTAPNTRSVIPGVAILDADAVEGRLGEEGFDDLGAALRVFVPGDVAAQATVSVIPEAEGLTGASFDLALDPGVVTDVPIEGLVDGSYSIVVESSVAVVTAMRASTVTPQKTGSLPAGASDVAWFAAAPALTGAAFVTIASGAGSSLHLVNLGDTAASVTVGGVSVPVAAGSGVTVATSAGASLSITGAEGLYASVSLRSAGRLAGYLVASAALTEPPLTVYRG